MNTVAIFHRNVCRSIVALLTVAALAACSSDRDKAPACPQTAIVTDAGSITVFGPGPTRDLLNVDMQAEIADLLTACKDKEERDGVAVAKVTIAPIIVANLGPANRNRTPTLRYFVSVVDANQQILQKQTFEVPLDFTENRSRLVVRDDDPPITIFVPNRKGVDARSYQVLLGFQLTQEQLTYNQQRGAGGVTPRALTRQWTP